MPDTLEQFARECVKAQRDYIHKERARMRKARESVDDPEIMKTLGLHPATLVEIDCRIRQLLAMENNVQASHGPRSAATRSAWMMSRHFTDKPCAASGLTSYRYKGAFGWIMIGATDHADALKQAARSLTHGRPECGKLQVWNEKTLSYRDVVQRLEPAEEGDT